MQIKIGNNFKGHIIDVFKGPNGQHIHKVKLLDGVISVGDEVELTISYQSDRDYEEKTVTVKLGSSDTLPKEKSDIIGR